MKKIFYGALLILSLTTSHVIQARSRCCPEEQDQTEIDCTECCSKGRQVSTACCNACNNCKFFNDEACSECQDFPT